MVPVRFTAMEVFDLTCDDLAQDSRLKISASASLAVVYKVTLISTVAVAGGLMASGFISDLSAADPYLP